MAKASSDKIPVILMLTLPGATRVFLRKTFVEDYFVLEADDPHDLLIKLKTTKVEAVILDDKLDIHIQQLLKEMRSLPDAQRTPFLVISSNLKRSYMKELLTAGATEFLREPLDKEEVLQQISIAMQLQSTQQKVGPIVRSISQKLPPVAHRQLSSQRVSMHDTAIKEINRALQDKQAISLLMVDIDYLEKVENRWGKDGLHELLELIETHLNQLVRKQDVVVHERLERFILILPKTSETAAKIVAENLEESFKTMKFTTKKGSVKLPISIGAVSLADKDMGSSDGYDYLEKMLKTGEADLEKAKQIGKRIVSK